MTVYIQSGTDLEMIEHLKQNVMKDDYVYTKGEWYGYRDGIWEASPSVDREVYDHIKNLSNLEVHTAKGTFQYKLNNKERKAVEDFLKAEYKDPEFFNTSVNPISFLNGTLVIKDNQLTLVPHSKSLKSTYNTGFDYDKTIDFSLLYPLYFNSIFELESAEKLAIIQEFIGAALFGIAPRYEVALCFVGSGSNGKSTLVEVLESVFDRKVITSISPDLFKNQFALEQLNNKRLNAVPEVSPDVFIKSDCMKPLCSGQRMQVSKKGKDPYDMIPIAAHIFCFNNIPASDDHSDGFWRRWTFIKFDKTFDHKKPAVIKQAVMQLQSELVMWALAGLERLLTNGGYTEVPSSDKIKDEQRTDSDVVLDFCKHNIDMSATNIMLNSKTEWEWKEIPAQQVYNKFSTFAKDTGRKLIGAQTFKKRMVNIFGEKVHRMTNYSFYYFVKQANYDTIPELKRDFNVNN